MFKNLKRVIKKSDYKKKIFHPIMMVVGTARDAENGIQDMSFTFQKLAKKHGLILWDVMHLELNNPHLVCSLNRNYEFKFTNTGDEPLIVSNVKSSCGCTIPKKPKKPILPGENGEIEVKYDTNRVNPIRKTITVTSNAVNAPTVALKITGKVIDPDKESVLDKKQKSIIEQ